METIDIPYTIYIFGYNTNVHNISDLWLRYNTGVSTEISTKKIYTACITWVTSIPKRHGVPFFFF
jgi:hypothetical protein